MAISKKQFRPHDRSNRHDKAVICFDGRRPGSTVGQVFSLPCFKQ
jgi:hypothetical protein